jgi:hypothetical protein
VNTAPNSPRRYCSVCGAEVRPDSVLCWCCRHSLQKCGTAASPILAEEVDKNGPQSKDRAKFQFTLASIMLIVTFAAVLMSIYVMAPGLGIALFILSAPALVRTSVVAMQRGSRGKPLSFGEKAGIFLAWIGVVLAALSAAAIGFFASCLMTAIAGNGEDAAMKFGFIGAIVAFVAAIVVIVILWRKFKV